MKKFIGKQQHMGQGLPAQDRRPGFYLGRLEEFEAATTLEILWPPAQDEAIELRATFGIIPQASVFKQPGGKARPGCQGYFGIHQEEALGGHGGRCPVTIGNSGVREIKQHQGVVYMVADHRQVEGSPGAVIAGLVLRGVVKDELPVLYMFEGGPSDREIEFSTYREDRIAKRLRFKPPERPSPQVPVLRIALG